ncbi:MAG TPA: hypothetical protein VM598_06585 [Bdellovibrionota bacterium]|nr:hypothetical protein [Bdellovibrionota bacterium]
MELNYDWRGFQTVFSPRLRALPAPSSSPTGPIYVIHDGDAVLCASARGESVGDWTGMPLSDFRTEFSHREIISFEREKVDGWMGESLPLPHFYDQAGFLLTKAQEGQGKVSLGSLSPTKHFLLEAVHGWWGKVLPSAYGIFLRLEGEGSRRQDFMIIVRRGRIDGFCEPDLSSIGVERSRQHADVVKYLSEKYLVPVQGVFLPESEWAGWASSAHPWRNAARAIRANRAKLVPFRWGVVLLMATRAFLEI